MYEIKEWRHGQTNKGIFVYDHLDFVAIGVTALCFVNRLDQCLELLIRTNRLPEAAFLARTYLPSQVSRVVKLWRENLAKVNQKVSSFTKTKAERTKSVAFDFKFFYTMTFFPNSSQAAESLADPTEYENLFPGLKEAFAAEHYLRESCLGTTRPATDYPLVTVSFKYTNK